MKTKRVFCLAILAIVVLCSQPVWAHKPIVINGGTTDAASAHLVEEIDISQVAYHEADAEAPTLWLTFNVEEGDRFYAEAGVPVIDRYKDLRPAMVLLSPDLPAVDVPFAIPEGYGGLVFATEEETPVLFDEEFTGTESWTFEPIDMTLESAGKYYLVGYLPELAEGKFWVAIGKAEERTR